MSDSASKARGCADSADAILPSNAVSTPGANGRGRSDAAVPLRLLLAVFLDDAALAARLRNLMGAIAECRVQRGHARWDCDLTTHEADDGPAAAVMLVGSAQLPAAVRALAELRTRLPAAPVIVLADALPESGLEALMAQGAFDFASADAADGELVLRVRRALGLWPAAPAAHPSADAADSIMSLRARLIGHAPEFMKLVRRVPAMASSDASLLLLGETGTGKEVCAQAIHYLSPRARGPWVAINCAAIPAELVEDELFGHVRGAYTHAVDARHGLVREAEGGTLFLDEIDAMPLAAQAKLLRFLQDKQYRVVGSSTLRTADVRVVAASNRDLRQVAMAGAFRTDLFYRLNVLCLTLPPLRERREDIPALAMHFMDQANREAGRHLAGMTPGALRCLLDHTWPGNVRELKHVLQRAVLLAQGGTLQASDIELDGAAPASDDPVSFREAKARVVEAFERRYLEQLLAQSEGNISRAAKAAQKNRRAFFELLRRHDIDAASFRGRLG